MFYYCLWYDFQCIRSQSALFKIGTSQGQEICQLFCSLVITLHSGTYFHSSFDIHYIGKKGVICIIPGHLLENDKKKTPMFLFFFHLTNFKTVPTYTSIRKSRVRIQQSTAKYYILNNSSQDNKRYISDIGLEFINERTLSGGK